MNYNLQSTDEPSRNFAARFTSPLWRYIVGPRSPEDAPYLVDLDFTTPPLSELVAFYPIIDEDVLEVLWLTRRVLVTGVKIEVVATADMVIRPVTNSGMVFGAIDCNVTSEHTYTLNGGVLNSSSDVLGNSIVVDDPDYLGIRIEAGAEYLGALSLRVQLMVSDGFSAYAPTNSSKKDGR